MLRPERLRNKKSGLTKYINHVKTHTGEHILNIKNYNDLDECTFFILQLGRFVGFCYLKRKHPQPIYDRVGYTYLYNVSIELFEDVDFTTEASIISCFEYSAFHFKDTEEVKFDHDIPYGGVLMSKFKKRILKTTARADFLKEDF